MYGKLSKSTTLIFISYLTSMLLTNTASALDVNISPDVASIDTVHNGRVIKIQRIQDQDNILSGGFSKTSRKCPPFCIQPMQVVSTVATVGELELLDFIKNNLNTGNGILVDARTPSWHAKGTIPGSMNIPFTTFGLKAGDLRLVSALGKLGVKKKINLGMVSKWVDYFQRLVGLKSGVGSDVWDFTNAKKLLLWCNGMWCGQSPRAIKGLLALGYPTEKILYYRGGMQSWQALGLTVVIPKENR